MLPLKKTYIIVLLLGIIVLGFYLRSLYLPNNLLFGFEQGRDFSVAKDIASLEKFTLLGPKTDIEGIYHGVFYYYFLALFFLIGKGNPEIVALFFNLLNLSAVILVYLICRELFNKKTFALLGALLASVSFNVLIYGRWISNVSPSIPLTAAFFLLIIKFLKTEKGKFLPFIFLCWGLFLHFEILNFLSATFLIAVLSVIVYFRRKNYSFHVNFSHLILSVFALAASFFPFLFFELRHNLLLTKSLLNYVSPSGGGRFSLINNVTNYFHGLNREITTTLFPFSNLLFFIILFYFLFILLSLLNISKSKVGFIPLVFLFWQLPLIIFLKYSPLEQFFSGANVAIIIAAVYILLHLKKLPYAHIVFLPLLLIYLYLNGNYTTNALDTRQNVYFHMPYKEITYGKQRQVFDYLILNSANNGFAFDAFTTPLYHPEGWEYVYKRFYENKITPNSKSKQLYLIIEPFVNKYWLKQWINRYDQISSLSKQSKIESIIIQERQYK
jgi:hypothetical protein